MIAVRPQGQTDGRIVLLGAGDASEWTSLDGHACPWRLEDGVLTVGPGSGNVRTVRAFVDFELHLRFRIPQMENVRGQERGNSGVYLQGLYEVQILDSFHNPTYATGACGALYRQVGPRAIASTAPDTWQVFEMMFRAPRMRRDGGRAADGWLTVLHNGVLIHDRTPVTVPTGGGLEGQRPDEPGPIMLQDHGCAVAFRDIWVKPA